MPQTRNQSLDLMRILAAFGIIWAHMQAPFMELGYIALALFVILTTVMAVGSAESRSFGRFMRGRFWRIFVPWLVWCLLYLLLEAWRADSFARLWQLTDWRSLLVGPYEHLWFLPFVLLTAPLAFWSTRLLTSGRQIWKATFPLALLGASAMMLHDIGDMPAPWIQWACAAISFFYGLLSAAAKRHGWAFAPMIFVVVATGIPILFWESTAAGFLLAAAFLFEMFWAMRLRGAWLPRLGNLAFGVYLVHPFIMLIWYKISHDQLPRSLGAVVVFALSLLAAAVIEVLWARILPRPVRRAPRAAQTASSGTGAAPAEDYGQSGWTGVTIRES